MRIAIVGEASTRDQLRALLCRLVDTDLDYLHAHPETPALYASGVRYQRETPTHGGHNEERFLAIPWVLRLGWGDCDDLTGWRVAELRYTGEDPHAAPEAVEVQPNRWHAVVRRGNGSIEDPSERLGMVATW